MSKIKGEIHHLKCLEVFYADVITGDKNFEIRYNDRDYKVGDVLVLDEILENREYTGRKSAYQVIYLLSWKDFPGLTEGYVCMGIYSVALPPKYNENSYYYEILGLSAD